MLMIEADADFKQDHDLKASRHCRLGNVYIVMVTYGVYSYSFSVSATNLIIQKKKRCIYFPCLVRVCRPCRGQEKLLFKLMLPIRFFSHGCNGCRCFRKDDDIYARYTTHSFFRSDQEERVP